MGRVFEEGIRSPQPRVTRATGEALIERLGTSLAKIHGSALTMSSCWQPTPSRRVRARVSHVAPRHRSSRSSPPCRRPRGGPLMRYMIDAEQNRQRPDK